MLRQIISAIVSFGLVVTSVAPAAAMTATDGTYFFRYKGGNTSEITQPGQGTEKDITAFYVGGLGVDFSERLPMKPEWEDDSWSVVSGTLPNGISFNPSKLTFEGTPSTVVSKREVQLIGRDQNNKEVATAAVTFDIYNLPDRVVNVDFYAHKDRFSSNALNLPAGVTIHGDPELISSTPPGVTYNARYFEGTPTKTGTYSVVAIGSDYVGEPVVAFIGRYIVEDGPTFARVPDDLRVVSRNWGYARWNGDGIKRINRSISGDPLKVRYYIETKGNVALPKSLAYTSNVFDRRLGGWVGNYYDQVDVRYRAVDTDGTVGYSNWFKLGSLGSEDICIPYGGSSIGLNGVANSAFHDYRIPSGVDNATKRYEIVSGQLPEGLTLDSETGVISGIPTKEETQNGIAVQITFPGNQNSAPVNCGPYDIRISPADFALQASAYDPQMRVGTMLDVTLTPTGGLIEPYTVMLDEGATFPSTVSYDAKTGKLSGSLETAGSYSGTFRLKNGDGVERTRTVSFSVHNALDLDPVSNVEIAQYDVNKELLRVTWDQNTIIGDERVELLGGPLPNGISFDNYSVISGGTRLPPLEGGYGPYTIRLSDGSGEHVDSDPFHIVVTERVPLKVSDTTDLEFFVNLNDPGQRPVEVEQAPLAKGYLPLEYSLEGPNGSALPDGLQFDPATGKIYGLPTGKGTWTGYRLTVNEISSDNLTARSDAFTITVSDPPPIPDVVLKKTEGNVDGPSLTSLLPTAALYAIRDSLVGYETSVTFDRMEPQIAGLSLNTVTGQIEGVPEEQFDGEISIFYRDGGDREGKLVLPLEIHPYPVIGTPTSVFEVPRLSDAASLDVFVEPLNEGFFKGVTWSIDPSGDPLPVGMKPLPDGDKVKIVGSTKEAVGTERHVKIAATSIGNGLRVVHEFTIKTVSPLPFNIEVPTDAVTQIYLDGAAGPTVGRDTFNPTLWLKGSYVSPLNWTISGNPSWMSIDKVTGQILGTPPEIGTWDVSLRVRDAEGSLATNIGAESMVVRATLSGNISIQPGGRTISARIEETLKTDVQTAGNAVSPYRFEVSNLPEGVEINAENGVISGRFHAPGTTEIQLKVVDDHGRVGTREDRPYRIALADRLTLPSPFENRVARLLTASAPVAVHFRPATNVVGNVSYRIVGDLPGTLYYKEVSATQRHVYSHYLPNGGVEVIEQGPTETEAMVEARLPMDRLIFDTLRLTLNGVPSKAGTFPIELVAYDDHMDSGYTVNPNDPTREVYNFASQSLNIVVEDRAPLTLAAPYAPQTGTQFDASKPVVVYFNGAGNAIGTVEYTLTGDIPGTLYYKSRTSDGMAQYRETQEGPVVATQAADETVEQTESRLAADRFIFDLAILRLAGVGSSAGHFDITLHAEDKNGLVGLDGNPRNRAEVTFAVDVLPAAPFEIANVLGDDQAATAETIHQFTTAAQIKTVVKNAAYGLPVTWTQVSGTLPTGLSPVMGASNLSYTGYPSAMGTFNNIRWKATDAAGRELTSAAVTLTVADRLALEIASNKANPRTMIVFSTEADMLISGKNTALNQPIAEGDWSITGLENLPPGLTHYVTPAGVRFVGSSDVIGTYNGVKVTGRDARNAVASLDLQFHVIANPAPIDLNVSSIKTKVGFPVRMEPPFAAASLSTGNTYGKIRFSSYDLPAIEGIAVNGDTGLIEGEFETVQKLQFDLQVTDETARVTSKPVQIEVMPTLRLIAPAQTTMAQGETASTPIATDYVIGKITYTRGSGQWPEGVDVHPDTGAIIGTVSAAVGTYGGLTIVGTDSFGTFTDRQVSNTFSISVEPIDATPVISDVSGNKLVYGKVGTSADPFKPIVQDSKFNRPWNYGGTVYALNHDVSAYGLVFNTATGEISGMPTKPVIFRDMVMTVTSARGDQDSTAPFWFGIAPDTNMTAENQLFSVRKPNDFKTPAPVVKDAASPLTFVRISGNGALLVSKDDGSISNSYSTANWTAQDYPIGIRATDEFGRTLDFTVTVRVVEGLQMDVFEVGVPAGPVNQKFVEFKNLVGSADVTYSGMPSYLAVNAATGIISGTIPDTEGGKEYMVTVSLRDSSDEPTVAPLVKTTRIKIWNNVAKNCIAPVENNTLAGGSTVWYVGFYINQQGTKGHVGGNNAKVGDVRFYDADGNCYTPTTVTTYYNGNQAVTAAAHDGNPDTVFTDGMGSGLVFQFDKNVRFSRVVFTMAGNTQYDLRRSFACYGNSTSWGAFLGNCTPQAFDFSDHIGTTFAPGEKKEFQVDYGSFPTSWGGINGIDAPHQ